MGLEVELLRGELLTEPEGGVYGEAGDGGGTGVDGAVGEKSNDDFEESFSMFSSFLSLEEGGEFIEKLSIVEEIK